jgi:serine/threonine protein kinase
MVKYSTFPTAQVVENTRANVLKECSTTIREQDAWCVVPPHKCCEPMRESIRECEFNEVYLLVRKCDMDLKKLLKSSKHLEQVQVKSIVYDILCGLNYLHSAKIIHRDLKPANILINDDCTIQICDYGLARSMEGVFFESSLPVLKMDKPSS